MNKPREDSSGGEKIQTCDIPDDSFRIEPFTLVIFGGAGDLSQRKLIPTLFSLFGQKELPNNFAIVGCGMPEMDNEKYRELAGAALNEFAAEKPDRKDTDEFGRHLCYLSGSFEDSSLYSRLNRELSRIGDQRATGRRHVIYYMAVPPSFTPGIIRHLAENRLCREKFDSKIIIEKPFGRNRDSARKLNRMIEESFDEEQIYRIDHYLGKETVQNIIFFRFSNSIFEPLWNRRYIDNIQITVAESLGIGHRGSFYESAGVVRDIVQNHMLQLVALTAMEPPVGFEADFIRDEKVKIFRSLRVVEKEKIDDFAVRGQYGPGKIAGKDVRGYRQEDDVSFDSNTPTFIAARLQIDNWRWAEVPFYIRTGKRLPRRVTRICIQFKQPPLQLFSRTCRSLDPNFLVLTIQPRQEIDIHFGVKHPRSRNRIYPVDMEFDYETAFDFKSHPPYQRLLIDCMRGDLTLFVRRDGVEAQWRVVDPIIERWENDPASDFPNYAAGTWGPKKSEDLLQKDGRKWITG